MFSNFLLSSRPPEILARNIVNVVIVVIFLFIIEFFVGFLPISIALKTFSFTDLS